MEDALRVTCFLGLDEGTVLTRLISTIARTAALLVNTGAGCLARERPLRPPLARGTSRERGQFASIKNGIRRGLIVCAALYAFAHGES